MQVIAQGRLKQRSYDDREGVKRTVVELDVDEIGPCLKFATAKVTKATRTGQGQSGGQNNGVQRTSGPAGQGDQWATAGAGAPAAGWGGSA